VDYGHNPGGMKAIKNFLVQYGASFNVGIITAVGDRRDADIERMGYLAADLFDQVVIRIDKDLRGRSAESLVTLLRRGIKSKNPEMRPIVIPDEFDAINYCMATAVKDALITVFGESIHDTCKYVQQQLQLKQSGTITPDHNVAHHA
jgi:cyanophycin synthetase